MRFEQEVLLDALKLILSDRNPRKEYELLQVLQQPPWEIYATNALGNELQLFQTHFTLFHSLYQLQEHWLAEGVGYLAISALRIQLLDSDTVNLIDEAERKVRAYYCDWRNFTDTTEQDVEALLDSFWRDFGKFDKWFVPAPQDVKQALAFFTLPEGSEWTVIKRCYLKFQLQNHPDRGGDPRLSKAASEHFDVLKRANNIAA